MRCSSKRAGTSIWRKLLLAKTSSYIDLNPSCNTAALCWSGRLLVQLHTLHYPWLLSEPLLRQFWAINWQRIRERTLQSHRLLHHFQFASWRGQQDGLNSSSTSCWSWLLPHPIPPPLLNCILSPYSYSISWDSKPIKLFFLREFPAASTSLKASEKPLPGWPALSAYHLGGPHLKEEESQHRSGRVPA